MLTVYPQVNNQLTNYTVETEIDNHNLYTASSEGEDNLNLNAEVYLVVIMVVS